MRVATAIVVLLASILRSPAATCSHPLDPEFYEAHQYKIGKIEFRSPFNFLFLFRQRLNAIKGGLPVQEGGPFVSSDYDASFSLVERAVQADSALGRDSQVKLVVTTMSLENCLEGAEGPNTVDVVYRIFSTDPIPAIEALPEARQQAVEAPATTAGRQTAISNYELIPRLGYDRTRRGYGGGALKVRMPGRLMDSFAVSGQGSSSSMEVMGALQGAAHVRKRILDQAGYQIGYLYTNLPASELRLSKGIARGLFLGYSAPIETAASRIVFRYAGGIEQGNQQTNLQGQSSRYGAIKLAGGFTSTSRYSEATTSYGFSANGPGLSNLGYQRHIVDFTYSSRFPGHTHRPWDVLARVTGGGITGGGTVLVNDRFFGGNTVEPFLPGASWNIPAGPLVRSIPANRLAGSGIGGTSFYSMNLTLGKVIKGWPLIPADIENAPGFDSGIQAAENTAETWFADDYQASAPEFLALLDRVPSNLKQQIDNAKALFPEIRAAGPVSPQLDAALKQGEGSITVSSILVGAALNPNLRGPDRAQRLRAWLTPTSKLVQLKNSLDALEPLAPAFASRIREIRDAMQSDFDFLSESLKELENGPGRAAALARAKSDMARPREIIDTLRYETNRYSFSLVGIVDAGRLWPDPYGMRYAFGGGGRFSLVNVNFTLGYAVNPSPRPELGQGRGAFFFGISYTNLFR